MKVPSSPLFLLAATGAASLALAAPVSGHEPLFGLGPHSIGKYSWSLESEVEGGDEGWANAYELAYGITPDVTVTAALPYLFSTEDRAAGAGDLTFRAKYRFLRRDAPGASDAFALHGGLKLPTGSRPEGRAAGRATISSACRSGTRAGATTRSRTCATGSTAPVRAWIAATS